MEEKVVGKWTGKVTMPETKKDDPAAKMAEAFAGMMNMTLEVKKDKTFAMTAMIVPVEGTWAVSGDKLVCTPTKVMGMTIDEAKKMADEQAKKQGAALGTKADEMNKPMEFVVSADGKTLTAKNTTGKATEGELIFKKDGA